MISGGTAPAGSFFASASRSAPSSPTSEASPPLTNTAPSNRQRTQQTGEPVGHALVHSTQDVGRRDSPRDHVDHIGLGQDRADRADLLRLRRLEATAGRSRPARRPGSGRCSPGTGPTPTRTGWSSCSPAPGPGRPWPPHGCAARRRRAPPGRPAPGTARPARASSCRRSGRWRRALLLRRRWWRCSAARATSAAATAAAIDLVHHLGDLAPPDPARRPLASTWLLAVPSGSPPSPPPSRRRSRRRSRRSMIHQPPSGWRRARRPARRCRCCRERC